MKVILADGPHTVRPLTALGYGIARASGFDAFDPAAYAALYPDGGAHCDMRAMVLALAALLAGGLTEAEPRDGNGRPLHTWTRDDVVDGMLDEHVKRYGRVALGLLRGLRRQVRRGWKGA